jgi:hypothetical protein
MIRTKSEWERWYRVFRKSLSESQLFELDQSEELQRALDESDYFGAEEIAIDLTREF